VHRYAIRIRIPDFRIRIPDLPDCATASSAGALGSYAALQRVQVNQNANSWVTASGAWYQESVESDNLQRLAGGTYSILSFIDSDGDQTGTAPAGSELILETGDIVCCTDNITLDAASSEGANRQSIGPSDCETL